MTSIPNEKSNNENSISENSSNVNSDLEKSENNSENKIEISSENNSENKSEINSENNSVNDSENNSDNKKEITKEEKKKINDDYYSNNKDRILAKRKVDREYKLNKAIDFPDTEINLTEEDHKLIKTIPIEKVQWNNYLYPKGDHKFIFPKGLERIFKKYSRKEMSRGLMLIGHAGNGKTDSVIAYSIKHKIPLLFTAVHDEIRSTDLLGSFTLNKTFALGNFPKAVEIANDKNNPTKQCILLIDEANTQNNHVQKLSNSNLDFKKGIVIPLIEKRFQLNEGCKVIVIGTMNYSSYAGTYQLNLEYNSRFDFLKIDSMPDKLIRQLLLAKNIPEGIIESLIITNKEILKAFEEEKILQPIDPRGLLKFAEDYKLNLEDGLTEKESIEEAIELTLVGRYLDNKEDLKFVQELIESNFNTDSQTEISEEDSENNSEEEEGD